MGLFFQLLARGIITGSLYALLGVSWGIIYNTTRTFHFAMALSTPWPLMGLSWRLIFSIPLLPAFLLGLLAAAAAGCRH